MVDGNSMVINFGLVYEMSFFLTCQTLLPFPSYSPASLSVYVSFFFISIPNCIRKRFPNLAHCSRNATRSSCSLPQNLFRFIDASACSCLVWWTWRQRQEKEKILYLCECSTKQWTKKKRMLAIVILSNGGEIYVRCSALLCCRSADPCSAGQIDKETIRNLPTPQAYIPHI